MAGRQEIAADLRRAFNIMPGAVVSIVGGGGKTTLMFALAREIIKSGGKVMTTTTTRIFEPSASDTFLIVEADEKELVNLLPGALDYHGHVTLAALRLPENKLKGISSAIVDRIAAAKIAPYVINEADGSAGKPLKAPNAGEPVIPRSTTLVIPVVGADVLGRPLTGDNVFRPEIASRLTGLEPGAPVTEDAVAVLLTHGEGVAKGAPGDAEIVPLINRIDMLQDPSAAESLAEKILAKGRPRIKRVVLGSFKTPEPVLTIVGD